MYMYIIYTSHIYYLKSENIFMGKKKSMIVIIIRTLNEQKKRRCFNFVNLKKKKPK